MNYFYVAYNVVSHSCYLSIQECIASMGYDRFWFKELDDVYFEVWQRLTNGTVSH